MKIIRLVMLSAMLTLLSFAAQGQWKACGQGCGGLFRMATESA